MDDVTVLCPMGDVSTVVNTAEAAFARRGLQLDTQKSQYLLPLDPQPVTRGVGSIPVECTDRLTLLGIPHGPPEYIDEVVATSASLQRPAQGVL